jgi:hypothetical protein
MSGGNRVGVGVGERSLLKNYKPPGPKAMAYINSKSPITLIMGPEGSGKSIASGAKMLWAAQQQLPSPHDNVVRVKGYIIRDTYRNLWDKAIPTYLACWPKDLVGSVWTGGKGEPATHTIQMVMNGVQYELIHEFRAFGDNNLTEFIAGLETTWIYLNEINTLPNNVLSAMYRRCGRYPAPHDRPEVEIDPWFGVFGDFNATDETHWLYDECIAKPKPTMKFIAQPSGFAADAENMKQLVKIKKNYYEDKAASMEPWEVKRMIENKWGFSRNGEPVYAEDWNFEVHVTQQEIKPDPNLPVICGIDSGGSPAILWAQVTKYGTLAIFDELAPPANSFWDAETFAKRALSHFVNNYPDCFVQEFYPDPAGRNRIKGFAQGLDDETITWINEFARITGWEPRIPPTNSIDLRLRAMRRRMRFMNGLRVSPKCKYFISGANAAYKLRKNKGQDDNVGENDRIIKNHPYSDIQDCGQYLALMVPLPNEIMVSGDAPSVQLSRGVGSDYDLPVLLD